MVRRGPLLPTFNQVRPLRLVLPCCLLPMLTIPCRVPCMPASLAARTVRSPHWQVSQQAAICPLRQVPTHRQQEHQWRTLSTRPLRRRLSICPLRLLLLRLRHLFIRIILSSREDHRVLWEPPFQMLPGHTRPRASPVPTVHMSTEVLAFFRRMAI